MLALTEKRWASKGTLLRFLDEVAEADSYEQTAHLTPESVESIRANRPVPLLEVRGATAAAERLREIVEQVGKAETGLASFIGADSAIAVVPPFPLAQDRWLDGADTSVLSELLGRRLTVGIVLLRLGRYAIGVLRGETLVASKSGSRYVKSRHRAGGSSQRRFERSRERLVRELFDKACEVTRETFAPFRGRIDYLLLGGERQTLLGFERRCSLVRSLRPITLSRLLEVDRPGQAALEKIGRDVWKSRVFVLEPDDGRSSGDCDAY